MASPKVLTVLFLFFLCVGFGPRLTPQEEVEQARVYLPLELDTGLIWDSCGTWNGFYFPGFDFILLCKENLDAGTEVARFIYLHELGHAYTFTRGIDFSRFSGNYEAAADEFAAVMSILQGHARDMLKVIELYLDWGKKHPHQADDPHPPMETRADNLKRIFLGYLLPKSKYGKYYISALRYWHQTLLENP